MGAPIKLEFTDDEFIVLVAMVGIATNSCLGRPPGLHRVALERMPRRTIDSTIGKFSAAMRDRLNGREKPCGRQSTSSSG